MRRLFSIPADYTEEVRMAQDSCTTVEKLIVDALKNEYNYAAILYCLIYNVTIEEFRELFRKAYN